MLLSLLALWNSLYDFSALVLHTSAQVGVRLFSESLKWAYSTVPPTITLLFRVPPTIIRNGRLPSTITLLFQIALHYYQKWRIAPRYYRSRLPPTITLLLQIAPH